jgi:hypothetical protein
MNFLKKFFFLAFKFTGETKNFVWGIVIHALIWLVAPWVVGTAVGVLALIPIIGLIFVPVGGLLGSLVGLYGLAGLVINILVQTKVIKE